MVDNGYIKLHRTLMDKPIWIKSTPEQKSILVTLLLMANHRDSEWEWMGEKFIVKPGQFITSIDSIRRQTGRGISIQNTRGALAKFQKLEFLTNKATKTGRLITIVNWASYQIQDEEVTKKPTKRQQRGNKEVTPNKNIYLIYSNHIKNAREKIDGVKITEEKVVVYEGFVNFLFGKTPDNDKEFDNCLSLKKQIDYNDFVKLMGKYDKDLIKDKVRAMENTPTLTKKYDSFYLTLNNWCKAG